MQRRHQAQVRLANRATVALIEGGHNWPPVTVPPLARNAAYQPAMESRSRPASAAAVEASSGGAETSNALKVTYKCARGYLWTEEIEEEDFSRTLRQAAADRDLPRMSAIVDGWVGSGGYALGSNEAKWLIDRGVPEDILVRAARRLGRYGVARDITLYIVSADA